MKSYTFTFTFYELPSAHASFSETGSGSSLNVALSRATTKAMKRPHVKGRRITQGKISFFLNTPVDEDKSQKE